MDSNQSLFYIPQNDVSSRRGAIDRVDWLRRVRVPEGEQRIFSMMGGKGEVCGKHSLLMVSFYRWSHGLTKHLGRVMFRWLWQYVA
jgi:hypothetical protein